MSDLLKQQVLSYLETHNTMTLGTCSGDVPWAATVFYASDDLRLIFFRCPIHAIVKIWPPTHVSR